MTTGRMWREVKTEQGDGKREKRNNGGCRLKFGTGAIRHQRGGVRFGIREDAGWKFIVRLVDKIGLEKCLAAVPVLKYTERLNPWENKEEAVCRYLYRKMREILCGVLALTILFLIAAVSNPPRREIYSGRDGCYLVKGEPGEKKILTVKGRLKADERSEPFRFDLPVPDRKAGAAEIEELFQSAEEYIGGVWLANNPSADEVTTNLSLPDSIPGTLLSVKWDIEDPALISYGGLVHNSDLPPEGRVTGLTARIGLGEEERNLIFLVHVLPMKLTEQEKAQRELTAAVNENAARTPGESAVSLPDHLNGSQVEWDTEKEGTAGWYPFLVLSVILGVCAGAAAETAKKMKRRKIQMAADYPDLISRISLYLGAGMSIRNAWERMVKEYIQETETDGKKYGRNKRYAYEEMKLTLNEMNLGTPAEEAFERFGRRTGELSYIRLGSLLAQNVKKGNERLTALMEEEEAESFARREEEAKKLGEEAGTKLLGPMMGILIIVIAVVLIPAFQGMSM